jgi:hypothetical protein
MSKATPKNEPPKKSALPVLAFVFAFLVPIAGIIMGRSALRQMYEGNISYSNSGLAMAAVTLGWIFTIVLVLLLILFSPWLCFLVVFLISGAYPLRM